MTQTMPETFPLGPGTLSIGATGTEIDVSCLINNAVLAADIRAIRKPSYAGPWSPVR